MNGNDPARSEAAALILRLLGPILHPQAPDQVADAALDALGRIFNGIATPASVMANAGGTSGLAIAPGEAAACLSDHKRSRVLLRALDEAIAHQLANDTTRPIHLLYAGCGPWATLITPLLPRYPSSELVVTLIDIHPEALESAHQLIETIGHGDSLLEMRCADAASEEAIPDAPYQILVSETMQRALVSEPQVAIALNLAPRLTPNGIMVPERIEVAAAITNHSEEFIYHRPDPQLRTPLGTIFTLDLPTAITMIHAQSRSDQAGNRILDGGAIRLPDEIAPGSVLILTTTITAFGNHTIAEYESQLTEPMIYPDRSLMAAGATIAFHYRLSALPELIGERIH